MVSSAGCSLSESFYSSLDVLYGDLGIRDSKSMDPDTKQLQDNHLENNKILKYDVLFKTTVG